MAEQALFGNDPFGGQTGKDLPVLRPLSSHMGVSLMLNPEGKVWLVHDKPFTDVLMWAEYDIDAASLTLVMKDGRIQELGLKIQPPVRKFLREARQIFTMYMKDEKLQDTYILPLLVRETGYYRA